MNAFVKIPFRFLMLINPGYPVSMIFLTYDERKENHCTSAIEYNLEYSFPVGYGELSGKGNLESCFFLNRVLNIFYVYLLIN